MRPLLFTITVVTILLACKKEGEKLEWETFAGCPDVNFDSSYMVKHIIGKWNLVAQACPPVENFPNVKVQFSADRQFEVLENGSLKTQGSWKFVPSGGGWQLSTSVSSFYFFGSTNLCYGNLTFAAQPVDGCNHYFERIP